jgi:ABC-type multidrug transport system permease subunit
LILGIKALKSWLQTWQSLLGKSLIFILIFAIISWVAFSIVFVVIAGMILSSNNTARLLGQKS